MFWARLVVRLEITEYTVNLFLSEYYISLAYGNGWFSRYKINEKIIVFFPIEQLWKIPCFFQLIKKQIKVRTLKN